MTHASDAYTRLNAAMEDNTPSCTGISLYTEDAHTRDELATLQTICNDCPIFAACETYARTARPTAGIWAGKNWTRIPRKEKA